MRHLLMDPAFPDIVGEWIRGGLNDNEQALAGYVIDGGEKVGTVSRDPERALYAEFNPQDVTWLGGPSPVGPAADPIGEIAHWAIARTRDW